MGKNLVAFGDFDEREAQRAERELDEGSKSIYKFPEGSTTIRIVPPPPDRNLPWVETWQHFVPVPGQDKPMVFNCPRKLSQGARKCPSCEKAFELYQTGNPMDKESAKKFWPKQKFYLPAIIRAKKGEETDNSVKVIAIGQQICKQLIEIRKGKVDPDDPEENFPPRNITHPTEGWDIRVTRKGMKQQDTSYTAKAKKNGQVPLIYVTDDDGSIKADFDAINEILKNPINLDNQIQLPTDEKIKKLMAGETGGEEKQLTSGSSRGGRTASDDISDEKLDDGDIDDEFEDD